MLTKRQERVIGALVGLVGLLHAQRADAEPFELVWDAPAECPALGFVEAEVTRVVGRPWQELGVQWREARASVTAEAGGYRLRMSLVPRTGVASERSILGASCTEASEAAVAILTAGMGVGAKDGEVGKEAPPSEAPAALDRAPSGLGASDGSSDDAGLTDEVRSTAPESEPGATRAHPVLAAIVGIDFGSLAAAAPFAQLAGGLELDRFALLGFVGATGSVIGEVGGARAGAQMFLVMGGLAGCVLVTRSSPVVSGCGGIEVGSLEASGFGSVESRDGRAFWSAGVLRAALDWHITGPTVLSAGVTAVFPLRELHVAVAPEEVHRTPAVAARPWLGLGWRFR